jgi:uncharacterized membrane protein YdjX (TVP38/TMEM64 family)
MLSSWTFLKRRAGVLVLLAIVVTLVILSDDLHAWLMGFLSPVKQIVRTQPVLGGFLFVLLAALSAMLAFVSSAVIVPVGVYVWGKPLTIFLLWVGWVLGGVCAYTISRFFGRPVVTALSSRALVERYEKRLSHQAPFGLVLLFQLALPSELPGYLLGMARYPLWKYLCALALAEIPYAVMTIYLGASFVERQVSWLIGVAVVAAAFSGWALYTLHRRVSGSH